jgi:pimeloyl-ACP methyl ester carboxylesterase
MPIRDFLDGQYFDPETTRVIGVAFESAYAREFAKSIAGARVELIDKAGHLSHFENSEAVGRTVRDFLGH